MNKVFLTGVIADLPTFRTETGEVPHLYFCLRVRHRTRSGETRSEFYHINAWRNPAAWGRENLRRGQLIGVTGYLTQRSVRRDEKLYSVVEIVATEFQPMRQLLPDSSIAAAAEARAPEPKAESV